MFNLGKLPPTPDARDLRFANYADVAAVLPKVPTRFGHGRTFVDWFMYGNGPDDSVAPGFGGCGDCVFAGGAHEELMFASVLLGLALPFTGKEVVSDYSAVTGYDPSDPSTDSGTYVRDALAYRQKTGLIDADGNRHKIGPYVALDPKNWQQLMAAAYIFGAVGIGFEFPASAWNQFDAGKPWDVGGDATIEGGHYVPIVGSMVSSSEATCVTWGRRQILTEAFYEAYNDEAWAYVPGTLRADGTGLHHLDLATLEADLKLITG